MQTIAFFALLFAILVSSFADQCPGGWIQSALSSQKCYLIVSERKNWFNAEVYCREAAAGAHLTSICSAFENADIVANVIDAPNINHRPVWIGLNDLDTSGVYQWTDDAKCAYVYWSPGQPISSDKTQCVALMAQGNRRWTVQDCAIEANFVCEVSGRSSITSSTFQPETSTSKTGPTDCYDLYTVYNVKKDGIYNIFPPGLGRTTVYCEMDIDGGGWTVIQRRIDNSVSFYDKTWNEYKNGFNNGLNNNLWLGNDRIHVLSTKDINVALRIDIRGDRAPGSSHPNGYWFGKYTSFSVDSERNFYVFNISSTSTGNASTSDPTEGINYNNGMKFSTIDVSHDSLSGINCSGTYFTGGWWLNKCTSLSLNGQYIPPLWHVNQGFSWFTGAYYINPVQSRMMLRKIVS